MEDLKKSIRPEKFGLIRGRPLPNGFTLYRQEKDSSENIIPSELMEVAYRATAYGFGRPNDQNNRIDVDNHITPDFVDLDWIADTDGIVVGFGATATLNSQEGPNIFYLGGLMLIPEVQGKGVGCAFIQKRMEEEDADFLALQTQNNYMLKAAKKFGPTNTEIAFEFGIAHRNGTNLVEIVKTSTGELVVERGRYRDQITGEEKCLYSNLCEQQQIEGLEGPGDAAIIVVENNSRL